MNNPRLTKPEEMKTRAYVYGVEKLNGYDAWALFQACALGDLPKVKSLLAKDRRLVNAQHWYQFPIHKAVSAGHMEIVKLLLERGADPGQSRYTYDSWDKLLLCASERGHRQIESLLQRAMRNTFVLVGSLLAHGANYNLSVAAAVGDLERVEQLLKKDSSLVRRLDSARISPLSYAAREGHLHIVRLLLERGADPNTPEDAAPDGRALYEACCRNHLEIAELLLKHGANPNSGMDSCECCL